jgi:hypothetical protein
LRFETLPAFWMWWLNHLCHHNKKTMWKLLSLSKRSVLTVCQLVTKSRLRIFYKLGLWAYSICPRKLLFNVYIAYTLLYVGNGNNTRKLSVHGMWFGIWLGRWSKTSWRAASRHGSESSRRDNPLLAKGVGLLRKVRRIWDLLRRPRRTRGLKHGYDMLLLRLNYNSSTLYLWKMKKIWGREIWKKNIHS